MTNPEVFSPEQTAGQRLMVGFDGGALNDDLKFYIDTLKIGGIILFKRNITSAEQTNRLCRDVQAYALLSGQPPLFIAIDQEGGTVARLPEPFTRFPGNSHIKTPSHAKHFAKVTSRDLKSIGVNMNMAPVMDVAATDIDSIMRDRAFGHDPAVVSELGGVVIDTFQTNGIMSVAKHFPGIGRTTLDSHRDRPIFDANIDNMRACDLIPFQAAIACQASGIMLSHILYSEIDPKWPASISSKIANDLLRRQMGYDGIVMTDDLDMGAIRKYYDIETVIDQILLADIDITLICHKGPDISTAFTRILDRIQQNESFLEKGKASLKRIMNLKRIYLEQD
jgi:beta-N-acetylhexosaminidase